MGRTATIIAVSYAVVCAFAIVFMLFVAVSTRGRRRASEEGLRKLGQRERTWFAIVIGLLVALLFATIFFTPYGRGAGAHHQTVSVKAVQFAWLIRGKPIKAGTAVEFRLTSADVNHGMAVYTQGGKLLFQVQVMPGKTQTYVYTFKKPGTYRILCLEYCGVDHDLMQGRLTVIP